MSKKNTKEEKKVYKDSLDLFGGCCALCSSPYVQMHHIRYGGMYGRKTYMGNVIPLCFMHHNEAHKNKKIYMPKLIDIIDERIKKYE